MGKEWRALLFFSEVGPWSSGLSQITKHPPPVDLECLRKSLDCLQVVGEISLCPFERHQQRPRHLHAWIQRS